MATIDDIISILYNTRGIGGLSKLEDISEYDLSFETGFANNNKVCDAYGNPFGFGTPVLYYQAKHRETNEIYGLCRVTGLFSTYKPEGSDPVLYVNSHTNSITHRRSFLDVVKLIEIESLSVHDLLKYTKECSSGTVILKIKDVKSSVKSLVSFIKEYKVNHLEYLLDNILSGACTICSDSNESDLFIVLYDIKDCIPIYNSRKTDGVGVHIVYTALDYFKNRGRIVHYFDSKFILSNYEDNIFVVDGVTLKVRKVVNSEYLSDHLMATFVKDEKYKKALTKTEETKPVSPAKTLSMSDLTYTTLTQPISSTTGHPIYSYNTGNFTTTIKAF
jgi:hypothetical protein